MRSIPYGYRIENGRAVIDEKEGPIVQQAFQLYLSGQSLRNIGIELGINRFHRGISNILEDKKYLGTEFYPAIVEKALFDEVQEVRAKSRKKHARPARLCQEPLILTSFSMDPVKKHLNDPFEQAQYVFTLIQPKE